MANTNKPLILALRDAKTEIANSINRANSEHSIPWNLILPIIDEMRSAVKSAADQELQYVEAQYKQEENQNEESHK